MVRENAIDVMLSAPSTTVSLGARPNGRTPHPLIGQTCFSITEISGGRAINIIPDECSVNFDWRLTPRMTQTRF
jgi:acetylornithine deacetylase/succinyl-diaminopimelate desuccinylase-like protein